MNAIEIVTIIAAIAGILGFVYLVVIGNDSLITLLRNRKKKDIVQPPRSSTLEFVTSKSALKSRIEYDRLLRERLRSYLKQEKDLPEPWIQMLNDPDSLTAPAYPIPQDSYFVDCICTALTKEGRTLAILPSGESYPDVEGIGRTSILRKLLGLSIDTGRLIGLQSEDIRTLKSIPIVIKHPSPYSLLATDMAYLGCTGGKLSLASTKGERMSLIWDLARHVYRTTTLNYKTGDHRKQAGRYKLLEIFNKLSMHACFRPIDGVFGQLEKLHVIDEVILLRREVAAEPTIPYWHELKREGCLEQLKKALIVSAQHGSEFWSRDKHQVELRVKSILDLLDPDRMPLVSEICFSNPESAMPDYVFDEITERIKTKENPPKEPTFKEVRTVSGIHLHNYQLSRGFHDASEVKLLVTSGEKIFRYNSFWNALCEARRPITLRILMLDPNSTSLNEREREAYSDKPKGFLKTEIQENIATIRRMSDIFAKTQKHVHIICRVYDERPSFRMTFIGRERLLVTSYEKGKRTGEHTIFYEIDRQNLEDLYDGFEKEYQKFERNSK